MANIGIFTDLHLGVKKDSALRLKEAVDSVEFCISTFLQNDVKTVVFGGDWFHNRSSINVLTLDTGIRLIAKLAEYFDLWFVIGNHDLFFKQQSSVHSLQFLNLLKANPKIHLVESTTSVLLHGKNFCFIPWLGELPHVTHEYDYVVGHLDIDLRYYVNLYFQNRIKLENYGEVYDFFSQSSLIDPFHQQSALPTEVIKTAKVENYSAYIDKFVRMVKPNGIVFSGHFHKHSETVIGDSKFIFAGCPNEQTWADENNSKGCYVLDTNTGNATFFENKNAARHVKISYSELKENKIQLSEKLRQGKSIVKFIVDAKYDPDEVAKYLAEIARFSPLEQVDIDYLFSDITTASILNIDNIGTNRGSMSEYIVKFIDRLDNVLEERKLNKDKIIEMALAMYTQALEEP